MRFPVSWIGVIVTSILTVACPARSAQIWAPAWMPSVNLRSAATWRPLSVSPAFGCNSVTFASDSSLGDTVVGRKSNTQGCDPKARWSLAIGRIDWANRRIDYEGMLLDTSQGEVTLGDGHVVRSAYDPITARWNGETWIAFVCVTGDAVVSDCVGPLDRDHSLDLSRTTVAVSGVRAKGAGYDFTAGVPKLLAFEGRLYLYWTMVAIDAATRKFVRLTVRGTELKQEIPGLKRLFAAGHMGEAARTNAPSTVDVFGLDPDDETANVIADIYQVITNGSEIYFTGARGGDGCLTPNDSAPGCYRLTIGKTKTPLAYHSFNNQLVPDDLLPHEPVSYARFLYRPSDHKTVLLVGAFHNRGHDPEAPSGMAFFVWPEKFLQ